MKNEIPTTIKEIHSGLKNRNFSARKLAEKFFENIKIRDKKINSFLSFSEDLALKTANEVDQKLKRKEAIDLLEGVPCAIKDNILVEGCQASAGSEMLKNYNAVYDATVVEKLKQDNSLILGKTNMDEFAMGSSTENSAFNSTKNPKDLDRVPGGSSGGSAAAVAADFVPFALGSDTGGSVRQPAAFCGVVGLKPTYGSVSRYGLIAMASSLDVIGPITKTVADARAVYKKIKGQDPQDATSSLGEPSQKTVHEDKFLVGIPKEYYQEGLDEETRSNLEKVRDKLASSKLGGKKIELTEVSLPHTEYALACYYIIMPSEVSANLARFDGIKYGHSTKQKQAGNLKDYYKKVRSGGFGSEVKRRIILGTFSLSSGYYEAYYNKAQQVRSLIAKDFKQVFQKVDCLLTPTTPTPAFKLGEKSDPLQMYLSDIYTVPANLAGLPALSVPIGDSEKSLPIGGQIITRQFNEELLFRVGQKLEQVTSTPA